MVTNHTGTMPLSRGACLFTLMILTFPEPAPDQSSETKMEEGVLYHSPMKDEELVLENKAVEEAPPMLDRSVAAEQNGDTGKYGLGLFMCRGTTIVAAKMIKGLL